MSEKRATIAALMIGRGGSSLKDKNILPVLGHPLLHWAAAAARRSRHIGRYYISSDDEKILDTAAQAGYAKIRRPDELASDTAQSCDAVRHALKVIEADGPVDIVIVQHANVGTISEQIIDDCIDQLLADASLSSVVPSHEHNEYHPMRAKGVTDEGLLKPFVDTGAPVSANRQDLPTCYFFDHSIWVLRADAIRTPGGQGPWDCMGTRIKPYPTKGCLDVHSLEDLKTTEDWIRENGIPYPDFQAP
ncbi:NTP transferase domain-containing protein [Rhodobacteraceae bacterium 2376]|uniref:NTP transferase domain-containing protein n=1 Tax=Rhabdonatronobacter sediminivivens TaxID=2743469 RepID=A0A7Z0I1I7_9RHOB|nr:NTP transferase domain-containing protein [Rhabdonatronobacter sediminivivens]NYS26218.1 NTP transferase domain-containing protein [Rhabdonatronobacter sediminivivens]